MAKGPARPAIWSRTLLPIGVLAAIACGREASTGSSASALTSNLPCDVQQVVSTRCLQCHSQTPKAGAPMSLATQADWRADHRGRPTSAWVGERIHDSAHSMPPGAPLDPKERDVLDAWIAGGTPPGKCEPAKAPDVQAPPCKADTILRAASPFAMGMKDDEYICFGVDVEVAKKRHVWAMFPEVDNANIVHHIQVFQAAASADPNPHPCAMGDAAEWKLIGGWAPGSGPVELPAEAGYPENPGTTHWVVQVHYNNVARRADQSDQSSFGLCTTEDLRPHDAGVIAFGALKFTIPPRSTHDVTCDFTLDDRFKGVHFFGGAPHLHKLGTALSIDRFPVDGTGVQSVLNVPSFDFNEQRGIPLSVDVTPGDRIQTRCEWKNPADRSVYFGEGTGDEMCLGFLTYYPAIAEQTVPFGGKDAPVFAWTTPSNNLPIMDTVRAQTGLTIPSPVCHEADR
jgi:hypothetical protein